MVKKGCVSRIQFHGPNSIPQKEHIPRLQFRGGPHPLLQFQGAEICFPKKCVYSRIHFLGSLKEHCHDCGKGTISRALIHFLLFRGPKSTNQEEHVPWVSGAQINFQKGKNVSRKQFQGVTSTYPGRVLCPGYNFRSLSLPRKSMCPGYNFRERKL